MKKEDVQNLLILEYLLNQDIISAKELALKVSLSPKTVRGKLEKIEDYLNENQLGKIEKKPGKGIFLIASQNQREKILDLVRYEDGSQLDFDYNLLESIIFILLNAKNKYITQNNLADSLYVSVPTVRKELIKVSDWLDRHGLSYEIKKRKGMLITNNEHEIRLAIVDFILNLDNQYVCQNIQKFCKGLNVEEIKVILKEAEINWKIQFSRKSFNKILIMVCLSISRGITENMPSEIKHSKKDLIESYNEYNFVESLYKELKEQGYRGFNEYDKLFLSNFILGANKLFGNLGQNSFLEKNSVDLEEFVTIFITSISEVLNKDITNDDVLYDNLFEHLKSAIFRMKYGQKSDNNLSKSIKKEYPDVFVGVWSTSQLFEEYYDIQITEEEISYLVLYIEAALLRKQKTSEAILCTSVGKSQSMYIAELIKKNIPEIKEIQILRKSDFDFVETEGKLIISNYSIHTNLLNVQISTIPSMDDFKKIREALHQKVNEVSVDFSFSDTIRNLFDPSLFFVNRDKQTKESLMKLMCEELLTKGYVKKGFFESVWEREEKTSTCIGDAVAIPHGSLKLVNESKIAIAILDEPIEWTKGEWVNTVFLLAVRMNNKTNVDKIKNFYIDLIKLSEDKKLLEHFRKSENAITAFQFLFN